MGKGCDIAMSLASNVPEAEATHRIWPVQPSALTILPQGQGPQREWELGPVYPSPLLLAFFDLFSPYSVEYFPSDQK